MDKPAILPERLAEFDSIILRHGSHTSPADGLCALELSAYLAGEPHSDHPVCACPVVAGALRRLNDRINYDDLRTRLLKPLSLKIIGSKVGRAAMIRRGYVATDMSVRVFAPLALDRRLPDWAAKLRALPEIMNYKSAEAGRDLAMEIRSAATTAAYATAVYDAALAADAAAAADAADDAALAAAADAAAYAYADAADRMKVYREGVRMIERMLEITD